MRVLAFPLHIASDWIGPRFGHCFASKMIFERSLEFILLRLPGLAGVIHRSSGVNQLSIAIEDLEMRRSQRAISARDVLRCIM